MPYTSNRKWDEFATRLQEFGGLGLSHVIVPVRAICVPAIVGDVENLQKRTSQQVPGDRSRSPVYIFNCSQQVSLNILIGSSLYMQAPGMSHDLGHFLVF